MNNLLSLLNKEKYLSLIIIDSTNDDIILSLKDILFCYGYDKFDSITVFYCSFEELNTQSFEMMMDDIGYSFKIIYGVLINKKMDITLINNYFNECVSYFNKTDMLISSHIDVARNINKTVVYKLFLEYQLIDSENLLVIKEYFKNNLNVLKTSQVLYYSRSSILFRLNNFYKNSSFDLNQFNDASYVYEILIEYHLL